MDHSALGLRVDKQRLWTSLMDLAKFGGTAKGGVCRLALSNEDKAARDQFVAWCREAGCSVETDAIGNIFARRPGIDNSLPPICTGSHIDSQPTGGKFDGAYGVMCGLEVVRALNDAGHETRAPIEISAWTDEEGSRFPPAMLGSGVFAGLFDLNDGLSRQDLDGLSLGGELARIGYAGAAPMGRAHPIGAFFEAHIEQGPILEAEGKSIGVVTDCQGQRWYEITLAGRESHAGPTPMNRRRDALLGASLLVAEVNRIGLAHAPLACATVGLMQVFPNSRNVIPGRVFLTVDFRHPDDAVLAGMDGQLQKAVNVIAREHGLGVELRQIWNCASIRFDATCVAAVRKAAAGLGYASRDIVSGAGQDACCISTLAPTSMIFIPCIDGISHNEAEAITPEWAEAGCNVLLHAMVEMADRTA